MTAESTSNGKPLERDMAALNEALVLGLVRQHELTEAAVLLNAQLQAEMGARKKAEEAVVRSEKLASMGRMAAVLAHEINNPLAAVMNLLFLAQATDGLPDVIREYLEMAEAELNRIALITRQTLGFYREEAAPAPFHITALLGSVLDLLRAQIKSAQAIVDMQCEGDLRITAFQGELRQVLANFLSNSLAALGENGKVTLGASLLKDDGSGAPRIRITVADNGKGISEEMLPHIFEPFFTTKGTLGNGLGLWVSKRLVEKHGGQVTIDSHTDGPQRGTTVSVVLPCDTA